MNKLDLAMAQVEDRPRDYIAPETHFLAYTRGRKQVGNGPVCDFYFDADHADCSGVVTRCSNCLNEYCEGHGAAGLCSTCIADLVRAITCEACGFGQFHDGLCRCPAMEPLTDDARAAILEVGA